MPHLKPLCHSRNSLVFNPCCSVYSAKCFATYSVYILSLGITTAQWKRSCYWHHLYRWLLISAGSASVDSTNGAETIQRRAGAFRVVWLRAELKTIQSNNNKIPESCKKQTLNLPHPKNYLHNIYIIWGITGNLEMTKHIQEDAWGLYAMTTGPFHIRDLSIPGCWHPWGSWQKSPEDAEGLQ